MPFDATLNWAAPELPIVNGLFTSCMTSSTTPTGLPVTLEPRHVEGLRQQRAHAGVDDMATRHVSRVGGALHEQLLLAGDERPDSHLRVIPAAW